MFVSAMMAASGQTTTDPPNTSDSGMDTAISHFLQKKLLNETILS